VPEVARPKYFLMSTDYINNDENSKLLNFHVVGGDTIADFLFYFFQLLKCACV
jgi:hypothetical protein